MSSTARSHRVGNLPAALTSFVGRKNELSQVKKLLTGSRLVTLTGVGGVGKTRLAVRVAQDLQRGFRDGTWLVELAPLTEPGLLAQSAGAVLGVPDLGARDQAQDAPLNALCEHLRERQLLLLLDNCEHLRDGCAALVASLLRACPDLRVLVTSRHRLEVFGEHTFAVPPLALPDPARTPAPRALTSGEAVALFVERASAAVSDFVLDTGNVADVAALCTRLDGIPLAIELAAVRLRALTPAEILARLDDRFRLLNAGDRSALPRQQTLQALIDWSFDLCSPAEQALWTRLSVFAGECDLAAVQEVCAGAEVRREEVTDLLAALVDKSVLSCEHRGCQARYRMLETLRRYGEERLVASGEASTLRTRHREHYRRLAEQAGLHWFTSRQGQWLDLLRVEHANLRAAMEFCSEEPGEAAAGLTIAAQLGTYWEGSGTVVEGRGWLELLLPDVPEYGRARAWGLAVAGWLAVLQGDLSAASASLTESQEVAGHIGEDAVLADVTLYRGMAAMSSGDLDLAERLYTDALERHRWLGNNYAAAMGLIRLALVASSRGDSEEAVARAVECRTFCEERGENWSRAYALWVLGMEEHQAGNLAAATALERESVRANHSFEDRLGVALGLEALATIAVTVGRPERAARLFGAAHVVRQATGTPLSGFGLLTAQHERHVARVRRTLGARGFSHAFGEGTKMTLRQAARFACAESAPPDEAAPPVAHTARNVARLTRREAEVAAGIARGLTNKEIAAALVIAQRTAETHVENIMAKLSFTSRAQVAAWMSEE